MDDQSGTSAAAADLVEFKLGHLISEPVCAYTHEHVLVYGWM